MSVPVQNHWFFSCLYCLFRFWTFVLFHGLSCRHHSQENPNEIWINVQGCFVIQLSRFCFHAKAFIFYHIDFCLSRTFFKFFQFLFSKLSYFLLLSFSEEVVLLCRATFISYHTCFILSRTFFIYLKIFFPISFKSMCSHVQRISSYHNNIITSSFFIIFSFLQKALDIISIL